MDLDACAQGKKLLEAQKSTESNNTDVINLPLLIQSERVLSLLDTGATISTISQKLCEKHNWKIRPANEQIKVVGNNMFIPVIGYTNPLKVQCNRKTITQIFEVIDTD
ncbi:hypothetical protein DFQ30_005403, partial [Apophysomyces sp. BC1015]